VTRPVSREGTAGAAPDEDEPAGGFLGSAAVVSVAFLAANALAYVFTVLAARALAPAAYGELAALLSVLLVGTVPAAGVQTAAALHLGGRRGDADRLGRLHATALVVAAGVCVLGALVSVPLAGLLHLPSGAAFWLVVLLLPHTLIQGYQGLLQGVGSYRQLAGVTVGFGITKLAGGLTGLLLGGTPAAALAGMTAGAAAGALLGWLACGRPGIAGGLVRPVRAALRASGALLGFVLLLNLDVLLARHHLAAAESGEYALAAVFTKVAFWLPQGVGVVLLPRLGEAGRRRRVLPKALALVASLGAALTLCTAALGTRALPLVGGSAYGGTLGSAAWMFAALGTVLAVAQLLLYSGIAAADRFAAVAVWTAAVLECVAVEALAAAGSLTPVALVGTATAVATALVAAGLLRLLRSGPLPEPGPVPVVEQT